MVVNKTNIEKNQQGPGQTVVHDILSEFSYMIKNFCNRFAIWPETRLKLK